MGNCLGLLPTPINRLKKNLGKKSTTRHGPLFFNGLYKSEANGSATCDAEFFTRLDGLWQAALLPMRNSFVGFLDDSLKRVVFSKKDFLDPKKDPKRNTPKQRHDPTDPPKRRFCYLWFGIPESFCGWKWDSLWEALLSGYVGVLLKIVGFDCWYITVDWSETKEKEEQHAGASVWFALKELHTALFVN